MKNKIVFVTTNKGKIASAKRHFDNSVELVSIEADLIEPRSDDIQEIAKQKVLQAYNIVKKPCIALDAGFYIKEFNGFPRAYVNHMLDTLGVKGILKLMKDSKTREAEFRNCLAFYDGKEVEYFFDTSKGKLTEEYVEGNPLNKWSVLWHIFILDGYDKTLAEFTEKEFTDRNKTRDSAMKQFANWYKEYIKSNKN